MGLILISDGMIDVLCVDDVCVFVFDGKYDCECVENVFVIAFGGDVGFDIVNEVVESWDVIEFSEVSICGM